MESTVNAWPHCCGNMFWPDAMCCMLCMLPWHNPATAPATTIQLHLGYHKYGRRLRVIIHICATRRKGERGMRWPTATAAATPALCATSNCQSSEHRTASHNMGHNISCNTSQLSVFIVVCWQAKHFFVSFGIFALQIATKIAAPTTTTATTRKKCCGKTHKKSEKTKNKINKLQPEARCELIWKSNNLAEQNQRKNVEKNSQKKKKTSNKMKLSKN